MFQVKRSAYWRLLPDINISESCIQNFEVFLYFKRFFAKMIKKDPPTQDIIDRKQDIHKTFWTYYVRSI